MSYDIYLKSQVSGEEIQLTEPHYMTGGTYRIGGTPEAHLNITYNYGGIFAKVLDGGIRAIYGMTGVKSIPVLETAIAKLKDDVADNYWDATEGNAKVALTQLLALAQMRPDGIWDGD